MQRFGGKLRALRKQHGLTQQQLARELGYVSQGYITEIEVGRKVPTAEFILKVADRFGVQTDVLMRDNLPLPQAPPRRKSVP